MWLLILSTAFVCLLISDFLSKRHRHNILKSSGIAGPAYTLPLLGDIAVTLGNDISSKYF